MSDEKEINVHIKAKTAGLTEGLAQATHGVEQAVKQMETHFSGLGSAVSNLMGPFKLLGELLVGGAIFEKIIESTVQTGVEMEHASAKTGMTVEVLSQLRYAADQNGVSFDVLTHGMQKLALNLDSAASGSGRAAGALTQLGLSATDGEGKLRSMDAMMPAIADKFSKMENGSQKTALAMKLFGRAGAELIPLLNQGKEGLAAMAEESDLLGGTMSEHGVTAAESYEQAMKKLHTSLAGLGRMVATTLMPVLQGFVTLCTIVTVEIRKLAEWVGILWAAFADPKSATASGMLANFKTAFQTIREDANKTGDAINRMLARTTPETEGRATPDAPENAAAQSKERERQQLAIDGARRAALAKVELLRDQYDFERKLGEHSDEDAIGAEKNFTAMEQQINEAALAAELALYQKGSLEYQRVLDKKAQLQEQYALKSQKNDEALALHMKETLTAALASVTKAFQDSFTSVIDRTATWADGMRKIGEGLEHFLIASAFRSFQSHMAVEQAKTGVSTIEAAKRTSVHEAAAIRSLAITVANGLKEIAVHAAKAMAAAYAALAGVPFIGPVLAPAAAIAAGAAVIGFGAKIASAEGGFDIPAGVNPMTQLHQREMVLPAELADRVRGMTGGASGGGGGDTIHVHAIDAQSFDAFLKRNAGAVASGVRAAVRGGHLTSAMLGAG